MKQQGEELVQPLSGSCVRSDVESLTWVFNLKNLQIFFNNKKN
jgi:hypothetical protein